MLDEKDLLQNTEGQDEAEVREGAVILAYKNYFKDFISSLSDAERNESFMEKLKQIRRIAAIFKIQV